MNFFLFLLPFIIALPCAAWYVLGLYDGLLKGWGECYLKAGKYYDAEMAVQFAKGWKQGFEVAEQRFARKGNGRGRVK
jgi:hypothetical protein